MFRKLRNRLIWINLGVTSIVIVVAFTAIYLFSAKSADDRAPTIQSVTLMRGVDSYGRPLDDIQQIVIDSLHVEKEAAARQLLMMLIVSGVVIEIVVALISYYLAEEAIKPVREAYEAQKVFIANASHEIKTPLAAISANLEAADIHDNKWISNVEKETDKLAKLNNELLALARTDLIEKSVLDDVDLKKVTREYLKGFEPRLRAKSFESSFATRGKVKMVRQDYEQVLGILLDNAIKYSDKKIVLELSNEKLTIANDGTVISKKDLEHVFERFYQADKSAEGVGLGLSIAKSVAMRNGWKLTATADEEMTRFEMEF